MDTNPKNCAKCGHTVNETAVACAYCGADISSEGSPPPPQPDELVPGAMATPGEPSSLPADDPLPVLDMADESASTPAGSQAHLDAEPAGQIQPLDPPADINETAAEGIPGLQGLSSDAEHQIDSPLPADEPIVTLDADKAAGDPEQGSGPDTISTTVKNSELDPDTSLDPSTTVDSQQDTAEPAAGVIPLADKVSAPHGSDGSPSLPDEPVLELSGEDSSESETLGADILELVEDGPAEAETTRQQPSEKATLSNEPAVETVSEIIPDPAPDGPDNKDGQQEAISLPPDDDVQSAAPSLPADVEEAMKTEGSERPDEFAASTAATTAKSDDISEPGEAEAKAEGIQKQTQAQTSVGALKIEKAAQELAEAQKKQKSNLAKAQARKKKKVELAKAQALKRKKAAALKARALKKQKEAQALKEQKEAQALKEQKEAQALKKQKEAQVGIEKAIQGMAADSNSLQVDKPDMLNQGMESNAKILNLLKKYENQAIGINYDNSADIKEAELVEANNEFFSVFVKDKELNYSHPLKTILTIIEGQDGVGAGKPEQESKFNAVIKVYPLVLF